MPLDTTVVLNTGIRATRNVCIQKFKQYILVLFKVLAMDRHKNVAGLNLLMESQLLIIRVNENMWIVQ